MAHLKYIQYVYTIVLSGEFMEYLYVDEQYCLEYYRMYHRITVKQIHFTIKY